MLAHLQAYREIVAAADFERRTKIDHQKIARIYQQLGSLNVFTVQSFSVNHTIFRERTKPNSNATSNINDTARRGRRRDEGSQLARAL
jgi:hypothetical protein